ncbi:MAG: hypothetical protein ACKVOH_06485 [Chlamydiales bacterium]
MSIDFHIRCQYAMIKAGFEDPFYSVAYDRENKHFTALPTHHVRSLVEKVPTLVTDLNDIELQLIFFIREHRYKEGIEDIIEAVGICCANLEEQIPRSRIKKWLHHKDIQEKMRKLGKLRAMQVTLCRILSDTIPKVTRSEFRDHTIPHFRWK